MKRIVMLVVALIMAAMLIVGTIAEAIAGNYEPEIISKAKFIVEGVEGLIESNEEEIEEDDFEYKVTISVERVLSTEK